MTKEELRAKYARVPTDFSQIALLKDQLIESGLLDVAQINPENAGKALVFNDDGTLTVGEGGGSGGIKLYNHYFNIHFDDIGEQYINIITNSSVPFVSVSTSQGPQRLILQQAVSGLFLTSGQMSSYYFENDGKYGDDVVISLRSFSDMTVRHMPSLDGEVITDIVTEL